MKIKISCDKNYGGRYDKNNKVSMMDCKYFNDYTLKRIISIFSIDDILEVTEVVVDFYNRDNTSSCGISFKSAGNIAKQLKKLAHDNP